MTIIFNGHIESMCCGKNTSKATIRLRIIPPIVTCDQPIEIEASPSETEIYRPGDMVQIMITKAPNGTRANE